MAFDALSYDEQVARLTDLAQHASEHGIDRIHEKRPERVERYGKSVSLTHLELVKYDNNAVFRLFASDPRQTIFFNEYMVRVNRPRGKLYEWIASECTWLSALFHDGDLIVPCPYGSIYTGDLEGIDEPVYCVLFEWIEGESQHPKDLDPDQVRGIGQFLAKLHLFQPLPGFIERPRLDYEGLFGERSPYNPKAGQQYITDASQKVLDQVAERVREVMTAMDADEHAFGLIHGDFIYKNTLFTPEGEVAAIDFDDCGFGYFLYDMACPLLFYKPLPAYHDMKAVMWEGYNSVRPLPEHYREYLEVLVAGRYVASCRWVAGNAEHPSIRGRATEIINGRVEELRGFLDTGVL